MWWIPALGSMWTAYLAFDRIRKRSIRKFPGAGPGSGLVFHSKTLSADNDAIGGVFLDRLSFTATFQGDGATPFQAHGARGGGRTTEAEGASDGELGQSKNYLAPRPALGRGRRGWARGSWRRGESGRAVVVRLTRPSSRPAWRDRARLPRSASASPRLRRSRRSREAPAGFAVPLSSSFGFSRGRYDSP